VPLTTPPSTTAPCEARPTRARHWVIVFAVTLAVLSYIDRVCISQAAPLISRDLGFSKVQMGYVFAAFGLAYAMCEVPGGWLGDWIGPRKVLMRIVLWWSFFTAATGWAWSFTSLAVTRFLFGAGEAGCFPNLTKAFTTWLPQHERVRAQGLMWTFARWGGAFTPPLVVLVFQLLNWRAAFMIFGGLGVFWAVFFFRWFRDNPRDHKSVNAAELALLAGAEKNAIGHKGVPWRNFVRSPSVWLLWGQYVFTSYPWYFYITWLPTYLQEHRGLSQGASARLAVLPLLFGGFGSLVAGFLGPQVARWSGSVKFTRRLMGASGMLSASLFLYLATALKDPMWAMLAMGVASFSNDFVLPGAWGTCMDVGGKYTGTLSGSMNMMGNLGGAAAPLAGGYILHATGGNWNVYLYTMSAVYVLAALCWLPMDPVTPLDQNEPQSAIPAGN
jgi:MFS transporter, ACS family, glucarate transporter